MVHLELDFLTFFKCSNGGTNAQFTCLLCVETGKVYSNGYRPNVTRLIHILPVLFLLIPNFFNGPAFTKSFLETRAFGYGVICGQSVGGGGGGSCLTFFLSGQRWLNNSQVILVLASD